MLLRRRKNYQRNKWKAKSTNSRSKGKMLGLHQPRQVCTELCRAGYFFPAHSLSMASKERMMNPAAAAPAMTKNVTEIHPDDPLQSSIPECKAKKVLQIYELDENSIGENRKHWTIPEENWQIGRRRRERGEERRSDRRKGNGLQGEGLLRKRPRSQVEGARVLRWIFISSFSICHMGPRHVFGTSTSRELTIAWFEALQFRCSMGQVWVYLLKPINLATIFKLQHNHLSLMFS